MSNNVKTAKTNVHGKSSAKSKKKIKKTYTAAIVCLCVLIIIIAVSTAAFFMGKSYYQDRFFKDTYINGEWVGGLTLQDAYKKLDAEKIPDALTVTTVDGKDFTFASSDFGYKINDKDEINKIFDSQNRYLWFLELSGKNEYAFSQKADYDETSLEQLLINTNWGDTQTKDASISLDDEKGYIITPQVQGNEVTNIDALIKTVKDSLNDGIFTVALDADSGCYTLPSVTEDDLSQKAQKLNDIFNISITYDFDYTTQTLTGKSLLNLLDIDDDGNYTADPDKAMKYVEKLADKYDTFNTERKFKATLQGDITVPPSSDAKYGWWIDQQKTCDALVEMLQKGESIENVDPIYYSTGYFDFTGVESARTKNDDIGSTYIEIDLSAQHLWYYKKGKLQYECDIVSGQTTSAARTTLPGVYKLWSKETNKRMKDTNADGDEWDTTCNFWNNVSLCGIGLHDSTWRGNNLGGTIYKWNGSHGCINMSYDGAKYVYDNVELGTPVVMYY